MEQYSWPWTWQKYFLVPVKLYRPISQFLQIKFYALQTSWTVMLALLKRDFISIPHFSPVLGHVKAKIFGSHFGSIILFKSMPEITTKKRTSHIITKNTNLTITVSHNRLLSFCMRVFFKFQDTPDSGNKTWEKIFQNVSSLVVYSLWCLPCQNRLKGA